MQKRFLTMLFIAPTLALAPVWAAPPPTVIVDGHRLNFDQPPVEQGGRLLVPLRGIFESLGAKVEYSAATRAIQASRGQTTVQLSLGSRDASVNGQLVTLDVPANTVGGSTMVPLRFVSEALGARVKWDAPSRTVSIFAGEEAPPPTARAELRRVSLEAQGNLGPGDVARVRAQGEPGGQAWFEIEGQVPRVDMQEHRAGHYVGSWTVPKGVQFQEAAVIVHVRVKGQEANGEAPTRLSVGTLQDTPGINVSPAADSMTDNLRPNVRVDFPTDIRLDSIHLQIDGNDCSAQALRNGRHLEWNAPQNLAPGPHSALVTATDRAGRTLRRAWSFELGARHVLQSVNLSPQGPLGPGQVLQVTAQGRPGMTLSMDLGGSTGMPMSETGPRSGNYVGSYTVRSEDSGTFFVTVHARARDGRVDSKQSAQQITLNGRAMPQNGLSITNPRAGSFVPPYFNIQGDTAPGAQVRITIEVRPPGNIPGGIPNFRNPATNTLRQETRADGRGHFDVPIQAANTVPGSRLLISVTAQDGRNQYQFPKFQVNRN